MNIRTSKNLTILGVAGILAAVAAALTAQFDGDPSTQVDWNLLLIAIWNGVTSILAKGQANTGGTVES